MPCPLLTIQEVEVYCLCHVFNALIFVSKFFSPVLVEHLSISTVWSSVFGSMSKCKIRGVSEELVPFPSRSEFKMVHNFGLLEHYYVTSTDCFNVGTPISTSRSSRDILKDPGDKLGDSCADSRQIGLSTANTPTDDSS